MELLVTISLSDKLFELLEDKLPNLGRRVEKAITKELGAQVRQQSGIGITVVDELSDSKSEEKPRRTRRTKAEAETTEAAPEVPETAAASAAEEAPQAEPQHEYRPMVDGPAIQPEKELTEEDIRAAMHRTRQRFEGEDYKENTASEGYKKYHKQLTGEFKRIAAILGADKPSALPVEQRAAFIAECEALIIGEDGNITPPPAPF